MADDLARLLAETYRWQRRLGNQVIATPHCSIVANPAHPDVWEANHADKVTAKTEAEIDAVFAAMDRALQIDNRNVRALAVLALRLVVRVRNQQSVDPQADGVRADELTSRALAVDSNNYLAHYVRSWFLAPQRPEEAIVEAERTLALNPSFLPVYTSLWIANWAAGRLEKADEYADAALRLGPHDSLAYV